MDIQPATPGASITEIGQQHVGSREAPVEDRTASDGGEATVEQPQTPGGYTSTAQLSVARAHVAGSISILA